MRPLALLLLAACATGSMAACRRDMYQQPKYKPFAANDFFPDGSSARPLPHHTVARGHADLDTEYSQGQTEDGKLVEAFPIPVTLELIKRGQERYNIHCAVCHGATGEGNGMIVQRGFPAPPSYHIDRLRSAPAGYVYHVITNGYGVMYSYASRVEPTDRWAIIAYIRALQLSRNGTLQDIPEGELSKLKMQ
jgi:hypothetical protein